VFAQQWHELTPQKKVIFQEEACQKCVDMSILDESGRDRSLTMSRSDSPQETKAEKDNDSGFRCRKCHTRVLKTDKVYPTGAKDEYMCRNCVRGLIEGWTEEEATGHPTPTENPMQQKLMKEVSRRLADKMYKSLVAKQVVKKEE